MTSDISDEMELFVWRRAFRSHKRTVVRADVVAAFAVSVSTASNTIASALISCGGLLERHGYKVIAPPWAQAPHWADEADLMDALDKGDVRFAKTGLTPRELPVNFSSWSNNLPSKPGAFMKIVAATTKERPLHIRYVGLKAGDLARYRRIFPIALERMGDQWRVVAHDLEVEDFSLRTFILARITGAVDDDAKLPKGFILGNSTDYKQKIQVDWDLRLNKDQREALTSELGIDSKGLAHVNSRDVHEFLIRYGCHQVSSTVVWPPFRHKT